MNHKYEYHTLYNKYMNFVDLNKGPIEHVANVYFCLLKCSYPILCGEEFREKERLLRFSDKHVSYHLLFNVAVGYLNER